MTVSCEACGKPPAFQVYAYGAFGGPPAWRWFCERHSDLEHLDQAQGNEGR